MNYDRTQTLCAAEGCTKAAKNSKYCDNHWEELWR